MKEVLLQLFKKYAVAVTVKGKTYYHLPVWFSQAEDGTVVKHKFDELPPELKLEIDMLAIGNGILLVGDDTRYFKKKEFAVGNNGFYNPQSGESVIIE